MVRAILEGRKTQTRRVVKKVSADCFGWFDDGDGEFAQRFLDERGNPHLKAWRDKCPYGQPGDRRGCARRLHSTRSSLTLPTGLTVRNSS